MNLNVSGSRVVGRARLLIGLLLAVVLLGACRVDNVVTLTVKPNGSGNIALVTTVDAEIVANNPGIESVSKTQKPQAGRFLMLQQLKPADCKFVCRITSITRKKPPRC